MPSMRVSAVWDCQAAADLQDKDATEAVAIATVRFIFLAAGLAGDTVRKKREDDVLEKGRANDATIDAESLPVISKCDHFPVLEATAGLQ